jgi:hypothetical protein
MNIIIVWLQKHPNQKKSTRCSTSARKNVKYVELNTPLPKDRGFLPTSLYKKEFKNMLKNGHSADEFYLHGDFYDDNGTAQQPMFKR